MSEDVPVLDPLREDLGRAADDCLPPHYLTCLGCGPSSSQGFHLQVRRDGHEVVADYVFDERHSGAPGIAHGGAVAVAVAAVVDDLLGFLLYVLRKPGVTRRLEVDYLKPVLLGVRYTIRGRVERESGRQIWVACEAADAQGATTFTGIGLLIAVELSHFTSATSGAGQAPIAP